MRNAFTLFSGIFLVMALSNAIVPVRPAFASGSSLQGTVYAAYFLGAFLSTLPAGVLADRFGQIRLIRAGLFLTLAGGIILSANPGELMVAGGRVIEGIGAGCFVAATLSYVNSRPDHERASGYFMALMNAGLVLGLLLSGWLAQHTGSPAAGLLLFTGLAMVPACMSLFLKEPGSAPAPAGWNEVLSFVREYRMLWVSTIVLIGITGVVSSLYPRFSGLSPESLGYWTAAMSIATIGAVLAVPRLSPEPFSAIRWSALLTAAAVLVTFISPWGFALLGALAGVVMIAQMLILAERPEHQGIAMGLFSTMSYLGMTILPFIAGIIADTDGFFIAFTVTAFLALLVAAAFVVRSPSGVRSREQ